MVTLGSCLRLLIPFLIWLFIFRRLFLGQVFTGSDNLQYVHWIAYYIENISYGIYPMWNPYHAWGSIDNFDMRFIGEFNPMITLMMLWVKWGAVPYWVFISSIVLYFWLACLGAYVLAKKIFSDRNLAFLVYVLLLFSSLGISVLFQVVILIIIVPTIWFFAFFIGFLKAQEKQRKLFYAAGMTFALMLIVSSYLPFYFITAMLCFLLTALVLMPDRVVKHVGETVGFICKYPWHFLFFALSVALACLPAWQWYQETHSGQYVLQIDRVDPTSKNLMGVTLDMINTQGLPSKVSFEELFTNFKTVNNLDFIIPIELFIFLMLSIGNPLGRRQAVIFITGLLLFLIALVDVTPFHAFLYHHLGLFHLFRNYSFFCPFIIGVAILFAVGELKVFLDDKSYLLKKKYVKVAFILLIHAIFGLFLFSFDYISPIFLISVLLSAMWFMANDMFQLRRSLFIKGLIFIVMMQAYVYLSAYTFSEVPATQLKDTPFAREKPIRTFNYLRPLQGQGINEAHGFHRRTKMMKDESGFFREGYAGTEGGYQLHEKIAHDAFQEYIRHKFMVYDKVVYMDHKSVNWAQVSSSLQQLKNEAYVDDPSAQGVTEGQVSVQAQKIEGPSAQLTVTSFDVNQIKIKTNFPAKKFLVYNDSYHKDWEGFVDGKKVTIVKSNMAFKGLWVEEGEHVIHLKFKSLWHPFFMGLVLFFMCWFIGLLILGVRGPQNE